MSPSSKNILFVLSSANNTLSGTQAGWYLSEAAHPYHVLFPTHNIEFAAPKGPNPPVNEVSVNNSKEDEDCVRFLTDVNVIKKLANAKRLADVDANEFDAIFYVGGYGPPMDLADDPVNAALASSFFQAGKPTAAVCHGPAGLVGAIDAEGKSIFAGRAATGFSDAEEEVYSAGKKEVPFLLETRIKSLGATFSKANEMWESHVVVDGNLITGQNPGSARLVGEKLLEILK